MEPNKTPLYQNHIAAAGRMVEFAGFLLPVQYTGILAEHTAVRQKAGLFDVSHMGEIAVRGEGALGYLNHLLTNDFTSLRPGSARYSPMCCATGGTLDDVLVYMLAEGDYLVVVNASNRQKDYAWMRQHAKAGVSLADESEAYSQLALQGPKSESILLRLTQALPQKSYTFIKTRLLGGDVLLSRTGYTGEDGFEIYSSPAHAPVLWNGILQAGEPFGLIPCGLGARDTLRLEAAMPLYGHELTPAITPLQAALGRFVKLKKDFIGKDALAAQKKEGFTHERCGLRLTGRGIAREGARVFSGQEEIGFVTSGTKAPHLGVSIAMAYVRPECITPGGPCQIEVRGSRIPAEFTALPFYKRNY